MRINADHTSPHFWPLHFKTLPLVRLDGKEISSAFMADDKTGVVEVLAEHNGAAVLDDNGQPFRRMLRGKVEIVGPKLDEAVN